MQQKRDVGLFSEQGWDKVITWLIAIVLLLAVVWLMVILVRG